MQTGLVDAHLHLQDRRFSTMLDEVISRARKRGVTKLFCNAVDEADWAIIAGLAGRYPSIIPFLGIHPWSADSVREGWQERLIETAASFARFGGIGEAGLDKSCAIDFDLQKNLFAAQLELAAEHRWPLSVHCVRAWGPLLEILAEYKRNRLLPRIMIHAFNGSTEMMKRLSDLGCYISYAESLADAQQDKLRITFQQTPHHLLLLETDAPYAKNPKKYQNDRERTFNQPADVAELYRYAADLLSVSMENLSTTIWENAAIFTHQDASR